MKIQVKIDGRWREVSRVKAEEFNYLVKALQDIRLVDEPECIICAGCHKVKDLDGVLTDFPCVCQVAKDYDEPSTKIEKLDEDSSYTFADIINKMNATVIPMM